jgi:superoxide dismutase, Cu-Zn family
MVLFKGIRPQRLMQEQCLLGMGSRALVFEAWDPISCTLWIVSHLHKAPVIVHFANHVADPRHERQHAFCIHPVREYCGLHPGCHANGERIPLKNPFRCLGMGALHQCHSSTCFWHESSDSEGVMKCLPIPQAAALVLAVIAPGTVGQPVADVALPSDRVMAQAEISKLIAIVRPVGKSNVNGSVTFEKTVDGVKVTAVIGGLTPGSQHAFHIHEFGDLGSDDASSAGEHFNPDGHPHGLPGNDPRHAGDLGNLKADADGNATLIQTVKGITLDHGKAGILGRAVIVHAKPDDAGQPSGNAGGRIGAGVIGISKDARPGIDSVPPLPGTGPGR